MISWLFWKKLERKHWLSHLMYRVSHVSVTSLTLQVTEAYMRCDLKQSQVHWMLKNVALYRCTREACWGQNSSSEWPTLATCVPNLNVKGSVGQGLSWEHECSVLWPGHFEDTHAEPGLTSWRENYSPYIGLGVRRTRLPHDLFSQLESSTAFWCPMSPPQSRVLLSL